jgi:hypothetical protein
MFARGTQLPPLILFEEKGTWRDATPVLCRPNRPFPVDFKVTAQYRAGYHVSTEIPAVDINDDQRLVFLKYYAPDFGLRYVGAMYVNCLQDVSKGYKGISAAMQARFNMPCPDNLEYYRLLGPDCIVPIDMSIQPPSDAPNDAPKLHMPNSGEVIVLEPAGLPIDTSFAVRFSAFPRFRQPEHVPQPLTFGELLLKDAETGFVGVDVKFIGGADDNKYCLTAHRSALCTTEYFRTFFTTGMGEPPAPPKPDGEGFYQVNTPAFVTEPTMRHFIRWIYTRTFAKELKFNIPLCMSLSKHDPLMYSANA